MPKPAPVSTRAIRVWVETWVADDSAASHYYARFSVGGERAHIMRPVTAADRDLLRENYRLGDPTSRFNSIRDMVIAAVKKAREIYGADVTVEFSMPYISPAFVVEPGDDPATCEIDERAF